MNDADPEWETGRLLLGDFEVQRVLGQGGMGKVYLVRSRTTGMEFAVKRAHLKDEKSRQDFLGELKTWIDLPNHPHVTACRFFRSIGDEVVIFADYIAGGTLSDWIRNGRLKTLEQMLDVATQFAWGLHAIHEHGLIHQDVKPGNVLMTSEGIAKITDFGLARAQLRGGDGQFHSPNVAPSGQSLLVSFGGMTPAYCSPEQCAKQPLSRKTDIWSWGVSVLDMFCGRVSCRYGQAAGAALEGYFDPETIDKALPRMPVEMIKILGNCFQPKPEHRWENMGDVADALLALHSVKFEQAYSRQNPMMLAAKRDAAATDRRTGLGVEWGDPQEWLAEALEADDNVPASLERPDLPKNKGLSRKAQAVEDMAGFEQARAIFERLVRSGRKDVERRLASLCFEQAMIHRFTNDAPGAIRLYDQAIEIMERLANQKCEWKLVYHLAGIYIFKAVAVAALNDNNEAVVLYDRAIGILERLMNQEGRHELADDLASAYVNKGVAVSALGDDRAAVALYDQAIEIAKPLVNNEGHCQLPAYTNFAKQSDIA